MLALLFNQSFWYDVLIVIAVIGIIIICTKYPNGKVFMFTFLAIGITVFTMYAGVQLNYYYRASGGVYGYITGLFKPNEVTIENAEFTFSNMELKQINETNDYGAYITTSDVISFEDGKTYGLFINDMPAKTTSFSSDYIQAEYSYAFYDNTRTLLIQDTLYFNFAFHTNSTNIEIFTKGGSEAVKYWNYWFNKNVFIAKIDQTNYIQSNTFNYRDLKLSDNESVVAYYLQDELQKYEIVDNGEKLNPDFTVPEGIEINSWEIDGQTVDIEEYTVSKNVNVYANWEEMVFIELRAGKPSDTDYTLIDSKWYSKGTSANVVGSEVANSSNLTLLLDEFCYGNESFEISADTKVEDIPNGVIYVKNPEVIIYGIDINTDLFDRETNSYTYTEYLQVNEIALAKVKAIKPASGVDFTDWGYNQKTSLTPSDFIYNGFQASYSGTKTWTNSSDETEEKTFSFSLQLNSDFSITFKISENLNRALGNSSLGILPIEIELSSLSITFTENIFYLI